MRIGGRREYNPHVKVLVVDDVARVRARLVAMLKEIAGVTAVLEASAVAPAIALLRAHAPDIVVLDLHLGEESGLTLARLSKLERPGGLLIVMTNQPTGPLRRECHALGVDYFFDKSRDFEDVLRVVAEAVAPTLGVEISDG
jgi:DNA-binding NarL/FixJ family response regulator